MAFSGVDAETFEAQLQAAYESGAAMTMMEGLDDETDLIQVAQQLPEPSGPAGERRRGAHHSPHQRGPHPGGKEERSDIHIEPYENRLAIRFRIDGVLQEVLQSRRAVAPLVVSRVQGHGETGHRRETPPPDGRISLRIAGHAVDVRVSTIPSGHGERVVLRLLDKQAGRLDLAQLGMSGRDQRAWMN